MLHPFRLFYIEFVIILRTPSVCVEIWLVYSGNLKLENYFVQTHSVFHPNLMGKGINVKKSPKCNTCLTLTFLKLYQKMGFRINV